MTGKKYSSENLDQIFDRHVAAELAELEKHIATLEWGPEALRLGRALAAYEDQRGWRDKSRGRITALLKRSGWPDGLSGQFQALRECSLVEKAIQAGLMLDLVEHAFRWSDSMLPHLGNSQRLVKELGDWELSARQFRLNALHAVKLGSVPTAEIAINKSLELYKNHADWPGQALALNTLAYIIVHSKRYEEAAELTGEILGDPRPISAKLRADVFFNHGYALRRLPGHGDEEALPFYLEGHEIQRQRRDPLEFGRACANLGALYCALQRYPESQAVYLAGLREMAGAHILDQAGTLFNNLMVLQSEWGAEAPILEDLPGLVSTWREDFISAASDPGSSHSFVLHFSQSVREVNKVLMPAARQELFDRMAPAIRQADVPYTGLVAQVCAVLAEGGADPSAAVPYLVERLETFLPYYQRFIEACWEAYKADPDRQGEDATEDEVVEDYGIQAEQKMSDDFDQIFPALGTLCPAAVVLLARSPEGRAQVRNRTRLRDQIARLAASHASLETLEMMLSMPESEELLVLRPGMKRGYRVRISGIWDNFQLHTLLADALIGDPAQGWLPGSKPDPRLVAVAKGGHPPKDLPVAYGAFRLVNWEGVRPDFSVSDDSEHIIWNEGTINDIHIFQDRRVILLAPQSYVNTWIAKNKIPGLAASLEVLEILETPVVEEWLNRIVANADQKMA
jgi:tetratricopeptide (TPR) repeat protein